ncbi:hypothetical protein HRR78_007581 [Exophiala dermatitidis]|nr:hypothetical protein HRR75_007210 [Exophiala dermatitidis]KAJ4541234.1 hypothetical protein HRR78_007581 [Exophiala dermatitidis]
MKTLAAAPLLLTHTVSAKSTVISMFWPTPTSTEALGSVIGTSENMTSMALTCKNSSDTDACYWTDGPVTVTIEPTSWHMSTSAVVGEYLNCRVSGTTAATCIEQYEWPNGIGSPGTLEADIDVNADTPDNTLATVTSLATFTGTDIRYMEVTVTAGASLLSETSVTSSASPSAPTASATASSTSPSSSGSATAGAESKGARKTDVWFLNWSVAAAVLMDLFIAML